MCYLPKHKCFTKTSLRDSSKVSNVHYSNEIKLFLSSEKLAQMAKSKPLKPH